MLPTLLAHSGQAHSLTMAQALLLGAALLVALPFLLRPARPLLSIVALATALGGVAHALAAPDHLEEDVLLGLGFLLVAATQAALAAVLVQRPTAALIGLAGAVNLFSLAVWGISRTVGLPFGPDAGVPGAVGLLDGMCAALELVAIVGGAWLTVGRPALAAPPVTA